MEEVKPKVSVADRIIRSCLEKKSYTLEAANTVVDTFVEMKLERFYYKCNLCCRYHITSKAPLVDEKYIEVI